MAGEIGRFAALERRVAGSNDDPITNFNRGDFGRIERDKEPPKLFARSGSKTDNRQNHDQHRRRDDPEPHGAFRVGRPLQIEFAGSDFNIGDDVGN